MSPLGLLVLAEISSLELLVLDQISSLELLVLDEISSLELFVLDQVSSLELLVLDQVSSLGLLVLDQISSLELLVLADMSSLELLDDAPVPVAEHQSSYFYDGWVALLLRDGARISKKGGVPPLRPSWLARVLWLTEAIIARVFICLCCPPPTPSTPLPHQPHRGPRYLVLDHQMNY